MTRYRYFVAYSAITVDGTDCTGNTDVITPGRITTIDHVRKVEDAVKVKAYEARPELGEYAAFVITNFILLCEVEDES